MTRASGGKKIGARSEYWRDRIAEQERPAQRDVCTAVLSATRANRTVLLPLAKTAPETAAHAIRVGGNGTDAAGACDSAGSGAGAGDGRTAANRRQRRFPGCYAGCWRRCADDPPAGQRAGVSMSDGQCEPVGQLELHGHARGDYPDRTREARSSAGNDAALILASSVPIGSRGTDSAVVRVRVPAVPLRGGGYSDTTFVLSVPPSRGTGTPLTGCAPVHREIALRVAKCPLPTGFLPCVLTMVQLTWPPLSYDPPRPAVEIA
jgi:hypothetical protein